jgi:hypothetical protein
MPLPIICEQDYFVGDHQWHIAGGSLVASYLWDLESTPVRNTVAIYSLSNGSLLWKEQGWGIATNWENQGQHDYVGLGISESVLFHESLGRGYAVRTVDGTVVGMPRTVWQGQMGVPLAPADTIVYDIADVSGPLTMDAYSLKSPSPTWLWSLPIEDVDLNNPWTFATGGTMYLAGLDAQGGYVIIPLRSY